MCKCNMCGHEVPAHEESIFQYKFGYFSKRDLDTLRLILCPICLDKLTDKLIEDCKINPVKEYESPVSERGIKMLYINDHIIPKA